MTELVVVGAGPAGLLAALRAAERGRRVLLLEKARRPGVKILVSGGTRCNVANQADRKQTLAAFGHASRFLRPAFGAFFRDEILALLDAEGVPVKLEPTGKYFPVSDRATDVQRALVGRALRAGVELFTDCAVNAIERDGGGLAVKAGGQTLRAARVILCSGGCSYPGTGTTGDGYRFTEALGHTLVAPRPALVPLRVPSGWIYELRGVSLPARLRLLAGDRRLAERTGDLLFTHFGLSGPAPMNLGSDLARHPEADGIEFDLAPGLDEDAVRRRLIEGGAGGSRAAVRLLDFLPARLAAALVTQAGAPADRRAAELSREERRRLVESVKRLRLPLAGTLGFAKAEVTAGGVTLAEVNPKTMASRIVPGLYLAGEVLDVDGPIGGFNFQAAFSTGWLAGESAGA